MKFISYFIPQTIYQSSSQYNKKIEVRQINGRYELLVNGIEQTGVYTKALWKKALAGIYAKNILVFGVGGGTVFYHFSEAQITGVDIDPEIIAIAKKYFGLQNVNLIHKDARAYRTIKRFDLIIVDLYIGNDVPEFATKKQFLLKLMNFLRNGGRMVINYYSESDQEKKAAKIASYFKKAEVKPMLRNIFIYVVK